MFPCSLNLYVDDKFNNFVNVHSLQVKNNKQLYLKIEWFKSTYALKRKNYKMYITIPSKVNELIRKNSNLELDSLVERDVYRTKK